MSTTTPESYVHLSTDKKTFTFYFDALRADRDGTTWGIEESQLPAWTSNINTTILTVVFGLRVKYAPGKGALIN